MKFFTALLLIPLCCAAHGHERVIAVSGYGEVSANPDTISITFELSERTRASIGEAKSALDELSSSVASALIAIGVQETDIRAPTMRTGEYQVQEKDKEPYVVRYASRSIKVIVRGVESYSAAVQALLDVGVTQIQNVESHVEDQEGLYIKALGEAVDDARAEAAFLADRMGVTLGSVHQIGDGYGDRGGDYPIQEIIVTARHAASEQGPESLMYEFRPAPVEVSASVDAEFLIE